MVKNNAPAKVDFPTLLQSWPKSGFRTVPLGFPNNFIQCSTTLAGDSYYSLVQLEQQKEGHGRLTLADTVMSTRLASNCSVFDVRIEEEFKEFYP